MERIAKERNKNLGPVSTCSGAPEISGTSNTTSYLLEQIGILKTRNQDILDEHKKTLRKYEDKSAEQDRQLASLTQINAALRAEVDGSLARTHAARKNTRVAMPEYESEEKEIRHHTAERESCRCRKEFSNYAGSSVELQKQLDAAERKLKDMMKVANHDKTEIKSLKSKLEAVDQEKTRYRSNHQEIDQLKKTIRQLEAKHKVDLHSLTTKLENEVKKSSVQTKQHNTLQESVISQLRATEEQLKASQQKLESVTRNEEQLRSDLQLTHEESSNLRDLVLRITEAYSDLRKNSTSLSKHDQLKEAYLAAQFRIFRLERRLADRDTVIEHVSDLCRQSLEEKLVLKALVKDLESERLDSNPFGDLDELRALALTIDINDIEIADLREKNNLKQAEIDNLLRLRKLCQAHNDNILDSYIISDIEASKLSELQHHVLLQQGRLMQDLAEVKADNGRISEELSLAMDQATESQTKCTSLSSRVTEQQAQIASLETSLKKDTQNIQRLTQLVSQSHRNESLLEKEVVRLSDALEDAMRYKEAHADLLSEVIALIQRNELAEAEAEHLSRFNAEVLSHKNPQQKIHYVDRIRTELAETKHELLQSTREREVLATATVSLQNELAAYKSITTSIEHKPVGSRVRVKRSGLDPLDVNRLSPE